MDATAPPPADITITEDDLSDPRLEAFLAEHLAEMRAVSPPESTHAMDVSRLRSPGITFWSAWCGDELVGGGALKDLEPGHGEIKSMRVSARHRSRGIASRLLVHIIDEAAARGHRRLSLETGSMAFFEPARRLYARHGFVECGPFGTYAPDPNSVFMTRAIDDGGRARRSSGACPKPVMPRTATLLERDAMTVVRVVPPDPAWASMYDEEARRLRDALGEEIIDVHHIGSTAIRGIHAKPIIDILACVRDVEALDHHDGTMRRIGYESMGEYGIPGRRFFRRDTATGVRTHHVHAFEPASGDLLRHLAFRDFMNAHPAAADAYGALKQRLAAKFPGEPKAYMNGKDQFIRRHEKLALAWVAAGGAGPRPRTPKERRT